MLNSRGVQVRNRTPKNVINKIQIKKFWSFNLAIQSRHDFLYGKEIETYSRCQHRYKRQMFINVPPVVPDVNMRANIFERWLDVHPIYVCTNKIVYTPRDRRENEKKKWNSCVTLNSSQI